MAETGLFDLLGGERWLRKNELRLLARPEPRCVRLILPSAHTATTWIVVAWVGEGEGYHLEWWRSTRNGPEQFGERDVRSLTVARAVLESEAAEACRKQDAAFRTW